MEEEYRQMMEERMQSIEDALERAKQGLATDDDWKVIYYECGLSQRNQNANRTSK
jgi:frataxin-like iron-binding protein CyaY